MTWPTATFWKLCALDLAAAGALAAVAWARLPTEQACTPPQAEAPGFTTLTASAPTPACLRFHIR